jgi:hypothetical protein
MLIPQKPDGLVFRFGDAREFFRRDERPGAHDCILQKENSIILKPRHESRDGTLESVRHNVLCRNGIRNSI